MSLYQTVKSAITVRQVGEMYGMEQMCIRDSHSNHLEVLILVFVF